MSYEDRARRRIALWLDTHPKITQRMVAEAASHLPSVMRYQHVSGAARAIVDRMNRAHGVHSDSAATRKR